ncbi:hypothetical protein EC957_011590 [Mortierella hygrophila]|uniref:Uncharacterized protein n=1 Tax=Mortierella hygrophila TaxID=979708 RepID=A0A9P6K3Q4_9FUNG|nr:hypothetical protein EC957_011590 [Mortierella hygrophila]
MEKSSSTTSNERAIKLSGRTSTNSPRQQEFKPSFVRFCFAYFPKDKDVEFVIQSLEWISQYWAVRKFVRKAVYADISPKRLTSGSKEHCIHVAQKLFRERLAAAAGLSRVPSSSLSPVDHRIHRSSYLQVDDNNRPATLTAGAFGHSFSSSSSLGQNAKLRRYSSVDHFGTTAATATASGPFDYYESDDENVHQSGHYLGLP